MSRPPPRPAAALLAAHTGRRSAPACRRSRHLPGRMAHRGQQASFHARHAQRPPSSGRACWPAFAASWACPCQAPFTALTAIPPDWWPSPGSLHPAPPASSFSEQVLSQRQVSQTYEAIAQTFPGCLAALLRRPRAAAVCCAMSAFSPCTEAEDTPSSETRMARLAPPATAGTPPGLCRPFHRTAARV